MKKILFILLLGISFGVVSSELSQGLLIHNNTDVQFRLHEYSRGTQGFQDKIFSALSRILKGSRVFPERTEVWLQGNINLCEGGFFSLTDKDKNTVHIFFDETDCRIKIEEDFSNEEAMKVKVVFSDNDDQIRIYIHDHKELQADPSDDFPLSIDRPDFVIGDWPIQSHVEVSNFLETKVSAFFINKEDCDGEFILGEETINNICHGEIINPEEAFKHHFVNTINERGVLVYSDKGKKLIDYLSLVTESFLIAGEENSIYIMKDSEENLESLNYRLPVYIYKIIDGEVDVQTFLERMWPKEK